MEEHQFDQILLKQYNHKMLSWDSLSLKEKMELFKKWYIIALLGDLCIIFGTLFFYASNIFDLEIAEMIIGIGSFFIWLSIVVYF